mmetsp:Transcript_10265/g.26423  ORF Transcript_10265/g.26423 Transcript_10265/m.26423 type:complete len:112 (+) Transcript_10265:193-528(+)
MGCYFQVLLDPQPVLHDAQPAVLHLSQWVPQMCAMSPSSPLLPLPEQPLHILLRLDCSLLHVVFLARAGRALPEQILVAASTLAVRLSLSGCPDFSPAVCPQARASAHPWS